MHCAGAVVEAGTSTDREGRMVPISASDQAASDVRGRAVTVLTADAHLADELQRLAAAAAVPLTVRTELPAGACWPPGLVLVGADLVGSLARRPGVGAAELVLVTAAGAGAADEGWLWRHAVAVGADQVVALPQGAEWLLARLARTAEPPVTAHVLGVVGGCGGAGASVFATALAAVAAREGQRTLLIDADPLGGGIDLLVGVDDVAGLRWPDLATARGRLPSTSLHDSLPRTGSLAVLGWGRGDPVDLPAVAVAAVLDAAVRGHDLVVLDLPRSLDAATQAGLRRVDELLVVLPARLRAVVAASQVVTAFGGRGATTSVVVRGGEDRWSARQVADTLGLPLAARLRDDARLDADVAEGLLPGQRARSHLRRAAEQCLGARERGRAA
jgi:secretion/DNA translocation related CpaE-like protein